MNKDNKNIVLYPSNWLYNAAVVGFIRFLKESEELKAKEGEDFGTQEDGTFFINVDLFKKFGSEELKKVWWNREETSKEKRGKSKGQEENNKLYPTVWGKAGLYPNYIQYWAKEFFFQHYIPSLSYLSQDKNKVCSWCYGHFLPPDKINELKGKFPGKDFTKFLDQREKFQGIHLSYLGAAITEMPNAFWDLNFSMPICHLCSFLIIFHHLAFVKTEDKNKSELFINTPNFKLTRDLNNFAEEILEKKKEYQVRKILGSSLLQWAIKRRVLLGVWTMMNIEIVIKKRIKIKIDRNKYKYEDTIDYFDLPYHITRVLLDYKVAELIQRINEEKIFDLIVSGKFSELEKANYFALKALMKLKNKENISNNDPIRSYLSYTSIAHIKRASELLPELYEKILKILNQTKGGNVWKSLNQ